MTSPQANKRQNRIQACIYLLHFYVLVLHSWNKKKRLHEQVLLLDPLWLPPLLLNIFFIGIFSVKMPLANMRSQQVFTWCSKGCRSRFTISLLRFGNLSIDRSGRRRWWSRSNLTTPRKCSPSPCTVPLLTVSISSILAVQRPRSIRDALTPGAWWVRVIVINSAANRQFVLRPRMLHYVLRLPKTSTDVNSIVTCDNTIVDTALLY